MKSFVGITGTTCVGKSAVAVELAKILQCDVISADSMQIYVGMDIGTAKVTQAEMDGVKHHMLDVIEPNCDFSSFEYAEMAGKIIQNLPKAPILVGGTGFYFDSLVYPPEFSGGNKQRRLELQQMLAEKGLEHMVDYLRQLDEETGNVIDVKNPVRVIRAIEIAESGQKQSQGTTKSNPQYDAKIFVLERDRQSLYQMIDLRVDKMVQGGLVDEVKGLVEKYGICQNSAFQAIGYKEIIQYLQGNCTLEEAIDLIKINTRHYAKRQISYFKRMNIAKFINVEGKTAKQIAQEIADFLVG
ncbi:MAG: tRNA (adenosine(37)-N6)-dimethylallyltransferase MiaA [Clostridia bacterium]|nr:tRNA (adenosine(37)-N6)-dimethylallyltransferase MiaA [Clostridia bacterium]